MPRHRPRGGRGAVGHGRTLSAGTGWSENIRFSDVDGQLGQWCGPAYAHDHQVLFACGIDGVVGLCEAHGNERTALVECLPRAGNKEFDALANVVCDALNPELRNLSIFGRSGLGRASYGTAQKER